MDIKKHISLYEIMISHESIFLSDSKFINTHNISGDRNKQFTTFRDNLVTANDNVSQKNYELGMKIING